MNRRRFVQVGGALAAWSLLPGCDLSPDHPETGGDGSEWRRPLPDGTIDRIGWEPFLRRWTEEALEIVRAGQLDFTATLTAFSRAGELRNAGASPAVIEAREEALGVRFPASFREFLRVSDGWRSPWRDLGYTILPLERLDWLRTVDAALIRAWRRKRWLPELDPRYDRYGPDQDPVYFRSSQLRDCIALSSTNEDAAVYLLNTGVATDPDELEAWDLDHRLPGAYRYRSFAGLMEVIHQEEIGLLRYWAGLEPG